MHHMVMLVLDNRDECPKVLDAWEAAGVGGITIIDTTGLGRVRQASIRDDIPLLPNIMDFLEAKEEHHRTLFTVVDSEEMVDRLITVTQQVVGDLNTPNKGLLFVLPVSRVIGLRSAEAKTRS
ncbi:MAG: hypothetical protein Fur0021_02140 [Candidatus Promineifilaceae bacterium]